MKVLVTGANGFVGSWLCRKLIEEGHEVHALVRKESDLSELEGLDLKYHYGDVTNLQSIENALPSIETVFHLAAVVAYRKIDRPKMDQVNIGGTQNVISAVAKSNAEKLVYFSSVVAVGAGFTQQQVLNEESEFNLHGLNLGYFETKHEAEKLVMAAVEREEIQAVAVNPATVYGPGDARKGSRNMQVKVARGEFKFYPPGGVNTVAVEDVVAGTLAAWKKGRNGERYILSSDNVTIQKLFSIIADEAGVPAPNILLPAWFIHTVGFVGDIMDQVGLKGPLSRENAWTSTLYHWFDNTKAKTELGFNPRSSEEAVRSSVRWMKENGYLK